jgi:hypothetical protein
VDDPRFSGTVHRPASEPGALASPGSCSKLRVARQVPCLHGARLTRKLAEYLINQPMGFIKPVFLTLVVVALATYGFDCLAMTTPEQAMQCCRSMPCSRQGHTGQDCCKTMPSMHAPFVQPSSGHGVALDHVAITAVPLSGESPRLDLSTYDVLTVDHSPPILYLPSAIPIRI